MDPVKERVRKTYHKMHANQTVDFVECKYDFKTITFRVDYRSISRETTRSFATLLAVPEFGTVRTRYTWLSLFTLPNWNRTILIAARKREWLRFDKFKMTVKDALIKLNDLVDESDPDTSLPNIVHAFQTAESIRKEYPDLDWFHLTGLIHDLGKVRGYLRGPWLE